MSDQALIDAIHDLASEIAAYRRIKQRGIELAEAIEDRRRMERTAERYGAEILE